MSKIQETIEQGYRQFQEKFVRDDGLLNKYTYDKDGDPNSTADEILIWHKSRQIALLKSVVEMVEGMKKEMELHECRGILCPHYPRTESHNFTLDSLKATLQTSIEEIK